MNTSDINLNLLRVFDAIYRARHVGRAGELLGISQPAASHGLTKLRVLLKDGLFIRVHGGMVPTARADELATTVAEVLARADAIFMSGSGFDPATSERIFKIHLSDIGETRVLPRLMPALVRTAPGVRLLSAPWPHGEIASALDTGKLDLALGYLPAVRGMESMVMAIDRYVVMVRQEHPVLVNAGVPAVPQQFLSALQYVAVRTHADTLRILRQLNVEAQVRLTASHFLALPDIVRSTDLAVLLPLGIARQFAANGGFRFIETELGGEGFEVSVLWSRRFTHDPGRKWLVDLLFEVYGLPLP